MKKLLVVLMSALLLVGCASQANCPEVHEKTDEELMAEGWTKVAALPEARDTTATYVAKKGEDPKACEADNYSADCSSINASNLFEYFGRNDVAYIDLRDYADYAKKHFQNFESIPYFALVLAMDGSKGNQLFYQENGEYKETYAESVDMLHALFPQDKTLFLMCQSGGRVKMLMNLLAHYGYDMSKIYNVGGMGKYTAGEYTDYITNTEEIVIDAQYSFTNLTAK